MLNQGEILILTFEDYSAYSLMAIVHVIQPFELGTMHRCFLEKYPAGSFKYDSDSQHFINFLIDEMGVIENVEYREVHLGASGIFKPSIQER